MEPATTATVVWDLGYTCARSARGVFFHVWLLQLYQAELGADKKQVRTPVFGGGGQGTCEGVWLGRTQTHLVHGLVVSSVVLWLLGRVGGAFNSKSD